MNKNKIIHIPDLISIGIYSALYFILVGVAEMLVVVIVPGYSYSYSPAMSALMTGAVFMLMVAKVPKFGAITIMGSVLGLFFFLSGLFPFALVPSVVAAVLADVIAYIFKYKSKIGLLLSYVIFSFNTTGPIIQLLFSPDSYVANLKERGKDASYIQNLFESISNYTGALAFVSLIIAAIIGGLFGQKMLKKHFIKAGIV
ncbi:MAG TPA: MptD family putative ECF transporter S component [Candidatus Ligilactobacillus excrementavium]|nr:MptD family putative ECF transporter S component [Candidatus Ligilactobacillus excrementavium]